MGSCASVNSRDSSYIGLRQSVRVVRRQKGNEALAPNLPGPQAFATAEGPLLQIDYEPQAPQLPLHFPEPPILTPVKNYPTPEANEEIMYHRTSSKTPAADGIGNEASWDLKPLDPQKLAADNCRSHGIGCCFACRVVLSVNKLFALDSITLSDFKVYFEAQVILQQQQILMKTNPSLRSQTLDGVGSNARVQDIVLDIPCANDETEVKITIMRMVEAQTIVQEVFGVCSFAIGAIAADKDVPLEVVVKSDQGKAMPWRLQFDVLVQNKKDLPYAQLTLLSDKKMVLGAAVQITDLERTPKFEMCISNDGASLTLSENGNNNNNNNIIAKAVVAKKSEYGLQMYLVIQDEHWANLTVVNSDNDEIYVSFCPLLAVEHQSLSLKVIKQDPLEAMLTNNSKEVARMQKNLKNQLFIQVEFHASPLMVLMLYSSLLLYSVQANPFAKRYSLV